MSSFPPTRERAAARSFAYLPAVDNVPTETRPKRSSFKLTGTETILLVEDDLTVRDLAERILVAAGFTVLLAAGGDEAISLFAKHAESIHLVITDVVMPMTSGRELAKRIAEIRPGTAMLFMSGYTDDTIAHHGLLQQGTSFISKPFTALELVRKAREVLDATGGAPA